MNTEDMNEQMKKMLSEERENISPKSDLKAKLDQAFDAKHKKTAIPLWLNYPVPAWQMAASIALLIVAGIALTKFKPEDKALSPIAIADTVFIEKIISGKTDTVFIEKKSVAGNKIKTATDVLPATVEEAVPTNPNPALMSPDMHISDFHNIQPNGSSLGEDSSAKNWTVRIM